MAQVQVPPRTSLTRIRSVPHTATLPPRAPLLRSHSTRVTAAEKERLLPPPVYAPLTGAQMQAATFSGYASNNSLKDIDLHGGRKRRRTRRRRRTKRRRRKHRRTKRRRTKRRRRKRRRRTRRRR